MCLVSPSSLHKSITIEMELYVGEKFSHEEADTNLRTTSTSISISILHSVNINSMVAIINLTAALH